MFLATRYRHGVVLASFLFGSSLLRAQSSGLDALRDRLTHPPTVTLNLQTLRLSRLVPKGELKIEGGVPKSGLLNLKLDTDTVVSAGAQLTVRDVDGSSDKKNDMLHITLIAPDGATAKLGFVMPKGALQTSDEAALEQLIRPVISPVGRGAGGDVSSVASNRPNSAPLSPAAPPKPVHDSKKVDFPPAAAGYPPMHANDAATDGCWYEPYFSEKYSVEFLYLQCSGDASGPAVTVAEGQTGPERSGNSTVPYFVVYTKRPDEPLIAAVKRVIISKFKDPAARIACTAKINPTAAHPATSVGIVATGTYAKRAQNPCNGLTVNEDTDTYYLDFTSEDKTKFIEVSVQPDEAEFAASSVHFLPQTETSNSPQSSQNGASSSSKQVSSLHKNTQEAAEPLASKDAGKFVPPQAGSWVNDKSLWKNALGPDAATVGHTDVGLYGQLQVTTLLVTCVKETPGSPHVQLSAIVNKYAGYDPTPTGVGTILIGKSRRDVQLDHTDLGGTTFDISTALTPQEAQMISANDMASQDGLSILFFAGARRAITSATLPEGNDAIDTVMKSCRLPIVSHAHLLPASSLSPSQVSHVELAHISLGMTADQVKSALGPGFSYGTLGDKVISNMSYMTVERPDAIYGITFIDGEVVGVDYQQKYSDGQRPLVDSLIQSMISKTWQPTNQNVGPFVHIGWGADMKGVPITKYNEPSHHYCGDAVAHGTADSRLRNSKFNGTVRLVTLDDHGPDCSVSLELAVGRSQDPTMADSLEMVMENSAVIRATLAGAHANQQQQIDNQRKQAGQVASPF